MVGRSFLPAGIEKGQSIARLSFVGGLFSFTPSFSSK
jgi:hypothetical protein